MRLIVRVNMKNGSFDGANAGPELTTVLRKLIEEVRPLNKNIHKTAGGSLYDTNGNNVGSWAIG